MSVGPATYHRPEHRPLLDDVTAALVDRRAHTLAAGYRLFYARPVDVVRARGTKIWDADGVEYLDGYNNVPSVGHSHPRIAEAVSAQLMKINTHTRYLHTGVLDYAEALLASFPAALERIVFTCTGSEANDLALRLAWSTTGHRGVIVTENAYHGVTSVVAEVSPSLGGMDSIGAHVRTVRPPTGDPGVFVAEVRAAIADLQESGFGVAALLVDSAFASDGLVVPSAEVATALQDATTAVRAAGGLLIADEVQSGFGRLGPAVWGFLLHGLDPEIVTMGKPMANGLPCAAVVTRADLSDQFGSTVRYFNTFGGSPVLIAAAHETWRILHDEDLPARAERTGARLLSQLRDLASTTDRIGDVRGSGLYLGVDIIDPETGEPDTDATIAIVNELRARQVLLGAAGRDNNSLKVRPPLPFDDADADRLTTALAESLAAL